MLLTSPTNHRHRPLTPPPTQAPRRPPTRPDRGPHDGEAHLVRAGWALVAPRIDNVAGLTFARLFCQHPAARGLFALDMSGHRHRLVAAVRAVVDTADQPARLRTQLAAVGRGCATLGAHPQHITAAADALLWSLAEHAGPAWTVDIHRAWAAAIGRATAELRAAAAAPAGCGAVVIRHRRVAADAAVLTVEPDQPYPYCAGQHAAVRLLRTGYDMWRPLAFAAAPRPDNRLTFWVRLPPAGGLLSTALVAHCRPGDRLRLGPPLGSELVVDQATGRGLVIVAAGAGYAAARAVLDQVARWDEPPPVRCYLGLRGPADAYLLADLQGVARVLPDPPVGASGPAGQLAAAAEARRFDRRGVPEVVRGGQHVLLAGPRRLIGDTAAEFARLGVPAGRIHADVAFPGPAAYGRTLAP